MTNDVQTSDPRVHVAGDASIDWFLALAEVGVSEQVSASYLWQLQASPMLSAIPGGADLVRTLVSESMGVRGYQDAVVSGIPVTKESLLDPNDSHYLRTFSAWRRVPRNTGSSELVWRMNRFIGWHPVAEPMEEDPASQSIENIDCLFLDDADQLFRGNRARWGRLLDSGASQIVLRQTGAVGTGELWNALIDQHADCLTVVCAVGDLRREGAPIGKPLSWERTAQDVAAAVGEHPYLRLAKRVIVLISTSGSVIVERDSPSTLMFDAFNQEGDWEGNRQGIGYGSGSCSVAAIVAECARNPEAPDFGIAAKHGLLAARSMFDGGYDATIESNGWRIGFPAKRIAPCIAGIEAGTGQLQIAEIESEPEWRLFDTAFSGSYRDAAKQIALEGSRAAGNAIPIERMGAWSSVDRIEIESMRSVRNIISEYLAAGKKGKPLNLAVFGPPGSGKSFAIKQMAKMLVSSGAPISVLEFNLSQFQSQEDLPAALQRVRDQTVQETLPLVFWDEFDSALGGREMGWLVSFLAPMQDGSFVEEGVIRPIGPAIFIFAGGTHSTMESFRKRAFELPGAKATDFLSRLRGFVNILGPNPDSDDDRTFALRRAMLLRAVLQGRAPQLFNDSTMNIDPGILDAFLDVDRYFHGSRSMESIIEMSAVSGGLHYERSTLPAVHQLDLHVNAEEFMSIVDADSLTL